VRVRNTFSYFTNVSYLVSISTSLSDSELDEQFIKTLLQGLEDYDEDYYKVRIVGILVQLLDKHSIQEIFIKNNGTQITIEYTLQHNNRQLKASKQINARFQELMLISKAIKLKEQLDVCKNFKLWEILGEYVEHDNNPLIIVFSLAILSSLCFDDECCYQIRIHCAYSVCKLLMNHITRVNPRIKGQYVSL
jgi:hypothetical protein